VHVSARVLTCVLGGVNEGKNSEVFLNCMVLSCTHTLSPPSLRSLHEEFVSIALLDFGESRLYATARCVLAIPKKRREAPAAVAPAMPLCEEDESRKGHCRCLQRRRRSTMLSLCGLYSVLWRTDAKGQHQLGALTIMMGKVLPRFHLQTPYGYEGVSDMCDRQQRDLSSMPSC
jgi:hypothetical protein